MMIQKNKGKICPICGCTYETYGRDMKKLCPWCDEDELLQLSKEALRRNRVRIEKGMIKSGKIK